MYRHPCALSPFPTFSRADFLPFSVSAFQLFPSPAPYAISSAAGCAIPRSNVASFKPCFAARFAR